MRALSAIRSSLAPPSSTRRPPRRRPGRAALGALLAAGAGAAGALPVAAGAAGVPARPARSVQLSGQPRSVKPAVLPGVTYTYSFQTLDDADDLTFNQLLGINDLGTIAGYFGSGTPATTHPNKGYTISAYSGDGFVNENFPGSQQTQVTGLNDMGKTVGFYVTSSGANHGFYEKNGVFTSVTDPAGNAKPSFTQLLGVNNQGVAAGFYNDAKGNSHAFLYNTKSGVFEPLTVPGAVSAMATGVNDANEVVGTFTKANKVTDGFVMSAGSMGVIAFPGSSNTDAFGINDLGQVVGQYTIGNKTHGFVDTAGKLASLDDPDGVGTTTINGINNAGDLVGFYTDAKGNTDGLVAYPQYFQAGT
jgi:hypothetical protein